MRKKIYTLVDCNSFYASCEKVFRPDLADKPVVVLSNNDGCVIALSKEAKKAGIKRGVPFYQIKDDIEKNGIEVFSSNYELYGDLSRRVMQVLNDFSPDIEVYSIDEAFLDITDFKHLDLTGYAKEIKNKIYKTTGLPVSVGVGETKTLAKLANHIGKKYSCYKGVFNIVNHPKLDKIFSSFNVSDIWGIGFQYTKKLFNSNIKTISDFVNTDDRWIKKNMTITGLHTAWELRGFSCIDLAKEIKPKKNILSSRSFGTPVASKKELSESITFHITQASEELRKQGSLCSFVMIFFSTNNFRKDLPQYAGSKLHSFDIPTCFTPDITKEALKLLDMIYKERYEYKRAGVLLGGLIKKNDRQFDLFCGEDEIRKKENAVNAVDKINSRHGREKITTISFAHQRSWAMKRAFKSPCYTTRWSELPLVRC